MADPRRHRRHRAATALAGVLVAIALLAPGASHWTARASGPTVTVSPATNLQNGEFVTLRMSGFAAASNLSFAQCNRNPANVATDCTPINADAGNDGTVSLNSSGAGGAFMPVYAGSDPNLQNQAQSGTLTCDVNNACTIAAFTTSPPSVASAVLVGITFSPSPNLCPPVTANRVIGAGSNAAGKAMYRWESTVCTAPLNLPVGYTPSNSPDGVNNFVGGGSNQYAVTGPWAPSETPRATGSPAQTWDYAPLANSSVVVAFLAFDQRSGAQITALTLTPDLVAEIFTGALSSFGSDPTVTTLNPNHHLPGISHTFARSEHDSETWEFTSWLSQTAASAWVYPGGAKAGQPIGATDTFPASGTPTLLSTGGDSVGIAPINALRSGESNYALFAVMDSSTAAFYGLPTVGIQRADGSVTHATPATITQALQDGTGNPDGTVTPDYATTDPGAWPMPMPLYALAPTDNVGASAGATLAGFLHYVTGAGQAALPDGYAPLTSAESAQTASAIAAIPTTGSSATSAPDSGAGALESPGDTGVPSLGDTTGFGDSGSATTAGGPGAATAGSHTGSGARSAVATGAALSLGSDGYGAVAPSIAGAAALCLLAGVTLDVTSRVRRVRARRRGTGAR